MFQQAKQFLLLSSSFLSIIFCASCTDYWWSRGQPPSVEQLQAISLERLAQAQNEFAESRPKVFALATELKKSLEEAVALSNQESNDEKIVEVLSRAETSLIKLDGKVTPGSLPALGELSGQLRVFTGAARKGDLPNKDALGLFASRCYSFLANELSVPL